MSNAPWTFLLLLAAGTRRPVYSDGLRRVLQALQIDGFLHASFQAWGSVTAWT